MGKICTRSFIPWPTFWKTNIFRVFRATAGQWREEEDEENEDEDGFHNGRFPIFLISNLFKFPTTVTSERFVRGEESCTE